MDENETLPSTIHIPTFRDGAPEDVCAEGGGDSISQRARGEKITAQEHLLGGIPNPCHPPRVLFSSHHHEAEGVHRLSMAYARGI